jgi:hypothetical protein
MEFCNWMDKLSKPVKTILAIFLDILFVIYRIIKDVTANNTTLLLMDILLGIVPIPFVFWIMNLIYIITKGQVFSFAEWVGSKDPLKEETKKDDTKTEEKKDDTDKK